jgi:hypothetical protein
MDMNVHHGMDMQQRHEHAARPWTCSSDMEMQQGHGNPELKANLQHRQWHAESILTCSIVMDMQHAHRHASWTRTCSMHADMRHGQGHTAETWTLILTWTQTGALAWTLTPTHPLANTYVVCTTHYPPPPNSRLVSQKIKLIQAPVP